MKTLKEHIKEIGYDYKNLSQKQIEAFNCLFKDGSEVLIEYHLRYNSTPKIEVDEDGKMVKHDYRQKKRFNNNDYLKTGNGLK